MNRMIGSHVWFVWKNLEEYLQETILMRQDCFVGFCVCACVCVCDQNEFCYVKCREFRRRQWSQLKV